MKYRKAIPILLAFPAALVVALPLASVAHADTRKCSTNNDLYDSGYTTTCNTYTDDGGWTLTTTHCDGNGNCETD
jgi:uncharacterized membrane protein